MFSLFCFLFAILASPFESKSRLEAENAVLRHQLIVLRRKMPGRVRLTNYDRWFLAQLYRWFPSILQVVTIVQPETLVRWHRAGFRCYWRWRSRSRAGRPQIETDLRALIRRMSIENPLWGAPRIHGELLKLGPGTILELDRKVGEAIDIYVNNRLVARGEVVLVEDKLGVTMTEIINTAEHG